MMHSPVSLVISILGRIITCSSDLFLVEEALVSWWAAMASTSCIVGSGLVSASIIGILEALTHATIVSIPGCLLLFTPAGEPFVFLKGLECSILSVFLTFFSELVHGFLDDCGLCRFSVFAQVLLAQSCAHWNAFMPLL